MRQLVVEQHVSARWLQFEMAKLIPAITKMELDKYLWALAGFGAGLTLLAVVAVMGR